ncbi:MAG: type II toxin-antitoxin system RelE/ParE family toxin [Gemmataceae bacterium]
MDVRYSAASLKEYWDAVAHYDSESIELGDRFMAAFDKAIQDIKEAPDRFAKAGARVRRHDLDRFPYGIVYLFADNILRIIAVAHHKRRPYYWRKRLRDIEDN